MSQCIQISRRDFLRATGFTGGAFILGVQAPALEAASPAKTSPSLLGYFVSIAVNGDVEIVCHRMEMGQGILTSVPQIIAEELGADWNRVTVRLGEANSAYGNQSTGGSNSIRSFFEHTRQMGAVARQMLEEAAAKIWKVDVADVHADNHRVIHNASGRSLEFAALAPVAAGQPVPDATKVALKPINEFKLIGRDVQLFGQEKIVRGQAVYAQDIQLPGMLIASIERPPVVAGRVKSFDASDALKVAGVVDVVQLRDRPLPVSVKPVSGVAVLATNTWAAHEGRKQLKIEWDLGPNAAHDSAAYLQDLVKKVAGKGIGVRSEGDVYGHQYDPKKTVEATYTVPYHHHMSMETPAATAVIDGEKCTVWTGTQTPQWGKAMILEELGLNPETDGDKVEFNTTLMGGAFGRKGKNDYTLEAVELAKATGKPVKVVWTREDDVRHGFYHSIAANYYRAELTADKGADFFTLRVAYPPIDWIFNDKAQHASNGSLSQSFADIPFELNHLSCETQNVSTHVRTGWLRSVQNINNAFAMGCFVDELAAKAGVSTRQMWLRLLGEDRLVDPAEEGFEGWSNYGQKSPAHALDIKRMKNTLNTVVDAAGAEKKLPKGEGWGISYATSFNSYAAAATRVRVKDKKVEVLEMHTAIDCGIAVTPDRVRSQMEGAMIMGLSMALLSEITVKDGVIQQSNFHDYPVARMPQVPPLHVHIVESTAAPGGVGEPGLPPVMPSLVNAIYHASGIRIRDLPVNKTLTV